MAIVPDFQSVSFKMHHWPKQAKSCKNRNSTQDSRIPSCPMRMMESIGRKSSNQKRMICLSGFGEAAITDHIYYQSKEQRKGGWELQL